ncbi:hypothetical protein ACF0H5_020396 [Mactra antiquata]
MHIFPWIFLRLVHGLCFLEIVDSISVVTNSGENLVAYHSTSSAENFKLIHILRQRREMTMDVDIRTYQFLCLSDLCTTKRRRMKRADDNKDEIAQTKQTTQKHANIDKQDLESLITPYAFGNPSLPNNQREKNRKKTKSG